MNSDFGTTGTSKATLVLAATTPIRRWPGFAF